MTYRIFTAAALTMALVLPFTAEERIDSDVNSRIRQEGLNQSRIMRTLHVLTDIHGPRVTGTPGLKAAGEWAVREMEAWGLRNGRLEPWAWGHPGWANEFASGAILSPVRDKLEFEVLAWTPGTDGPITGRAVHMIPPERPTEAELTRYLDSMKDAVRSAFVLVGPHRALPVNFEVPAMRRTDEQLKRLFDPVSGPPISRDGPTARGAAALQRPAVLPSAQVSRRVDRFLVLHGARMRINDAGRPHGQIAAFENRTYDVTQAVPTVVLRNEDYGRISRILAGGTPVDLQFEIVNQTYPEGTTAYNAIAEIPGTDLEDQVVMLGGHLDSWHAATGATDNAVGCAVMMEAARILQTIGVQPRRTVRVALWSGEEQGLLGSQAYVAQHFGSFEDPGPAFDKLVAYLNMDNGTGRVRGATVFGPPEAAQAMREIMGPFADFGVFGASATASRMLGGTDHTSFNRAGLLGINFTQDPIEYRSHTHHTNLDTYERIVEEDVKQSAVVIASVVYHLAMRDEPLPRFGKADMPLRQGGR